MVTEATGFSGFGFSFQVGEVGGHRSDGLLGLWFNYQVGEVGGLKSDWLLGLGFKFQIGEVSGHTSERPLGIFSVFRSVRLVVTGATGTHLVNSCFCAWR